MITVADFVAALLKISQNMTIDKAVVYLEDGTRVIVKVGKVVIVPNLED